MQKRILVADAGNRRLAAILAGHELHFAPNLAEAQRALRAGRFDLVAIDVHFDDSRMFDLLRWLQFSGAHAGTTACFRTHNFASPAITLESLKIATRALGATLFVDLTWYADDATGNGAVRALLDALLNP